MERKEAIRGAYRMTGGNSFYDGMITCSTLSGKAVCRLVWAMNKVENDAYLEKALSGIPEHFSGKLLEVPVGTGILTMPVYQTMPEADITCLDYSPDMMRQAREKADRLHLKNVTFRQGDVGALSYADDTFDTRKHLHTRFITQNRATGNRAGRVDSKNCDLVALMTQHLAKGLDKGTFAGTRYTGNADAQSFACTRQKSLQDTLCFIKIPRCIAFYKSNSLR